MKTSAKSLCIGCTTAVLISGAASAQTACSSYTVVEGDNLRSIARDVFGDADLYREIFDANRDVIGQKADLILIGAVLSIPCDKAASAPIAEAEAEVAVIDPAGIPLETGVVDPAKQPLEVLPELPVEVVDGTVEIAPASEEVVVEEVVVIEAAPEPEAVVEPAPEEVVVVEVVPEPEPVVEPAPEEVVVAEVAPEPEPVVEPAPEEVVVAEVAPEPEPVVEPAPEEVVVVEVAPEPEQAVEVEVAAVAEETAPAAAVEVAAASDAPLRIVTGNGYLPFADEMLPGGGMFTQIVEMAVFRADPDQTYTMTFINDWQAHIDALLPMQAYDLSFPWVRPECEKPEMLSAGDLARCNDFAFSAPYYEIVEGYFAAANSDLLQVSNYAEFEGKRICRPEGLTTGVLDAEGLTMEKIMLSRPLEASDCFAELAAGEVDLVSIDTAVGDATLKRMGMTGEFVQNPFLTRVLSLHVIAHKSNSRAVSMLEMLDEGAMEMNQSGEWWDIVSTALERQ
jgi:outer membrane biosynthesis protein TonB